MSYERQTDLALGCHKCGGLAPCQAMAVEVGANAMNMIGKGGWAGAACFYVYDRACPPSPAVCVGARPLLVGFNATRASAAAS